MFLQKEIPEPTQVKLEGSETEEWTPREKKLQIRIQELSTALEPANQTSEIRSQQSAELVNDVKKANS